MLQEGNELKKCFPEYTGIISEPKDLFEKGSNDVKEALEFIQAEFEKRVDESSRKRLHVHYIAARYKRDIKYSWEDVSNVLMEHNKKDVEAASKVGKK